MSVAITNVLQKAWDGIDTLPPLAFSEDEAAALATAVTSDRGDRDHPLTIAILEQQLVISIGINTLMIAVRGGDEWNDETMTILDPDAFAAEIAYALEHNEQEDGTTDIHLAIDKASMHVVESGSEAVQFAEEVYDDD